jgi:hypothetical protein
MDRGACFEGVSSGAVARSRRSAMLQLGSGGLALLLASRGLAATAQSASPLAGTPTAGRAYLAIRQYQLAPGHTIEDLAALVEREFVPIIAQVPGYQEYFLVERDGGIISISVFANQAGAEESTRRAAAWVQQNLTGFFAGPPTVTTGTVWVHNGGGGMTGTPAP